MKLISTKMHGMVDYLLCILLISSPWLMGFADDSPAESIPVILGSMMITVNLLTNYETGLFKFIGMVDHIIMDVLSGLFLIISPWMFDFHETAYLPHLIFGFTMLFSAMFTNDNPYPKISGRQLKLNLRKTGQPA